MPKDPSYLTPYHQAASDHGSDFEATLWASEKTQRLRFKVFAEMAYLPGKRILDAGCSRGDFAAYLGEQHIDYAQYIGLDAVDSIIQFAQTRNLPNSQFVSGDFVTQTDLLHTAQPQVIVFSGSLNTMKFKTAIAVLDAAWAATSQTLLFNFLSDRATAQAARQTGPARRLSTLRLLDWAMTQTDHVAFRQDYFTHGHDATVRMDKAVAPED